MVTKLGIATAHVLPLHLRPGKHTAPWIHAHTAVGSGSISSTAGTRSNFRCGGTSAFLPWRKHSQASHFKSGRDRSVRCRPLIFSRLAPEACNFRICPRCIVGPKCSVRHVRRAAKGKLPLTVEEGQTPNIIGGATLFVRKPQRTKSGRFSIGPTFPPPALPTISGPLGSCPLRSKEA